MRWKYPVLLKRIVKMYIFKINKKKFIFEIFIWNLGTFIQSRSHSLNLRNFSCVLKMQISFFKKHWKFCKLFKESCFVMSMKKYFHTEFLRLLVIAFYAIMYFFFLWNLFIHSFIPYTLSKSEFHIRTRSLWIRLSYRCT